MRASTRHATNNTLRAESIVEFERDSQAWVRFALRAPDAASAITVERRVSRHLRATQSGASEGVKRPVVRLQVRLGDVQDSFSFVLTDRAEAGAPGRARTQFSERHRARRRRRAVHPASKRGDGRARAASDAPAP